VVAVLMVKVADPVAATVAPFSLTDVAFAVVQLTLAVFVPLNVAVSVAVGADEGVTVAVRVTLPLAFDATRVYVVAVLMVKVADPDDATAAPFSVTDVAFAVVQLTLAVFVPLNVAVSVAVGADEGVTVTDRVTLPPGPVATSV
jgi:hypothetical protein